MTAERREERELIEAYRDSITIVAEQLTPANLDTAVAIARLPEKIRGYGHVKLASMAAAHVRSATLMQHFTAAGSKNAEHVQ
jgi:indolepyruvate ferredoxin oxidoreductase